MPIVRGQADRVRDVLHGELTGSVQHHYLTDGRHKYVWLARTGEEQLFDLEQTAHEEHDLSRDDNAQAILAPWRQRLIKVLKGRPEGFTDGQRLIPGQPYAQVMPGYDPDGYFPFT